MVRTHLLLWCSMQPQFNTRGAEPGLWDLGTWIWHLFLETNLAYMLFFLWWRKQDYPVETLVDMGGEHADSSHAGKKALM